jgi:hypothetical protein
MTMVNSKFPVDIFPRRFQLEGYEFLSENRNYFAGDADLARRVPLSHKAILKSTNIATTEKCNFHILVITVFKTNNSYYA